MQRILLSIITFFWMTASLYAQEKMKAPVSIYTFNAIKSDNQDTASLNKKLNIGAFKFVFFDGHRRDEIVNALKFIEIGETTPEYVFDAYTKYQNNNFIKNFIFENDPTRWNLHQRKNKMQPPSLNKE